MNLGPAFKETIKSGLWHITKGKRVSQKDTAIKKDTFITEQEIDLNLQETEIHIFPAIHGAGKIGAVILGVVLIIVGILLIWIGVGVPIIALGAGLIVGGIAVVAMSLLATTPTNSDYKTAEPTAQKPSFLFNGPVNVVEQGGPVPLVYGRHLAGSVVISAGLVIEQI
jgi:predicted phage tail protein